MNEELRKAVGHIRERKAMAESDYRTLKEEYASETLWAGGVAYGLMEALRILEEDIGL